jgi:hypothetical protein
MENKVRRFAASEDRAQDLIGTNVSHPVLLSSTRHVAMHFVLQKARCEGRKPDPLKLSRACRGIPSPRFGQDSIAYQNATANRHLTDGETGCYGGYSNRGKLCALKRGGIEAQ